MNRLTRIVSIFLLMVSAMGSYGYAGDAIISPNQARQIAESRFGGKVLSVTLVANKVYRVKMIKGGRVKIVTIEAKQ